MAEGLGFRAWSFVLPPGNLRCKQGHAMTPVFQGGAYVRESPFVRGKVYGLRLGAYYGVLGRGMARTV